MQQCSDDLNRLFELQFVVRNDFNNFSVPGPARKRTSANDLGRPRVDTLSARFNTEAEARGISFLFDSKADYSLRPE